VGGSTGDYETQSFLDRARETVAAVRFLRQRDDICRDRVGLWGFSQGGMVAPLAASLSPEVTFVIDVSGSQVVAWQQDLFRVEAELRADGFPDAEIAEAKDFAQKRMAIVRNNGSFEELDQAQRRVAGRPWFEYAFHCDRKLFGFGRINCEYDPAPAWEGVRCPVLAVFGDKDTLTPVERSLTILRRGLEKAGNPDVTIKIFPNADHDIVSSRTGGRKEKRERSRGLPQGAGPEFAPGYLKTMTDWLNERLTNLASSPATLAERARQHIQDKDWEGAARGYAVILRLNPYRADHWHNYGYVQHKRQRYEEAIRAWEKAAELGFAWDPLWERGLVWEKAWVTGFGPGTPLPWYNIARAQAQLGHKDDSLRALQRALEEGFADEESLRSEPDLASIRADPRFRSLTGLFPSAELVREDRWRHDLDYLARRLGQMHCQFGDGSAHEGLQALIQSVRKRVPTLKDHQIVVEIQRIMARAGDGHTRLWWPDSGPLAVPRCPLEFYIYSDGLFVRKAARDLTNLVGCRVLRVGGLTAEQALKAVEPFCSVDGPMGIKKEAPRLLTRPDVLETLGLVQDMDHVPFLLEHKDGTRVTVELGRARRGQSAAGDWVSINAKSKTPLPLYLRDRDRFYRFEHLPEARMVYFQYNAVADQGGESLAQFCRRMTAFIDTNQVENLVIDLRHNGGGNGLLNRPLLRELLRRDTINRKGHLFVILGRSTFSAALSVAADLQRQTECLVVGEPTCSGPNSRGQANPITLPCSGLHLSCASLYYQGALLSSDRRPWIAPDIAAELSSADEANNRDPALTAVLDEIRSR
jgi:pimeloyl-ACP methyl ester carboxylesterase